MVLVLAVQDVRSQGVKAHLPSSISSQFEESNPPDKRTDKTKPSGLEEIYASTISPSTQSIPDTQPSFTLSVPIGPVSPRKQAILCLLEESQKFGDIKGALLRSYTQQIKAFRMQFDEVGQKQLKRATAIEERRMTHDSWATAKKIATAISNAFLTGMGLFLAISGTDVVAGTALLASSFTALGLFVATQAGLWNQLADKLAPNDEEKQKQIKQLFPAALAIMGTSLGIYGGMASPADTTTWISNHLVDLLKNSVPALQGVTAIGESIAQGEVLRSQADLTLTNAEFTEITFLLQELAQNVVQVQQKSKSFNDQVQQIFQHENSQKEQILRG